MYQKLMPKPHLEDIIQHEKRPLVLASGGLDSGYMMFRLTEARVDFMVHHIVLNDGRSDFECAQSKMLEKQLEYLSVPEGNVLRSVFSGAAGKVGSDFATSVYLSMNVAAANNCDAVVTGDDLIARTINRDVSNFKFISDQYRVALSIGTSAIDLAKEYAGLPQDFSRLTWSCREPVKDGTLYRTCGACEPCERNKKFGLHSLLDNTVEVC